jgi:hypothetical protein
LGLVVPAVVRRRRREHGSKHLSTAVGIAEFVVVDTEGNAVGLHAPRA